MNIYKLYRVRVVSASVHDFSRVLLHRVYVVPYLLSIIL